MSAVYLSSSVNEIANAGIAKATSKFVAKTGRTNRPFCDWIKGKKKPGSWPTGTIPVYFKEKASNINGQAINGDETISSPLKIKVGIKGEVYVPRYVWNYKIIHDDIARSVGITILPNQNDSKTVEQRYEQRTQQDDKILYNVLTESHEAFLDRIDENWDSLLHVQGATSTDVVGLNGFLPIALTGNCCGIDRAINPAVQHVVFAGDATYADANSNLGSRGTTGSGGTLLTQLTKFIRRLRQNAATCGLPRGRWKCFAGSGWFDKYIYQANNYAGMSFNRDATGGGNVNLVLSDDDMKIAKDFDIMWDPTLDLLDTTASAEVGLAMSQMSCSFSGGGGSGATAVAYVTAAGVVSAIVLTNPGSGYTSSPTLTLGNAGSGASFASTVTYYKGSAGTNAVVVDADDARIGRLAGVTITNGGTGYPTTATAAAFTNRLYAMYDPAWEMPIQSGLDMFMSMPPDPANARYSEPQCDHMACLLPKAITPNGVFVAA